MTKTEVAASATPGLVLLIVAGNVGLVWGLVAAAGSGIGLVMWRRLLVEQGAQLVVQRTQLRALEAENEILWEKVVDADSLLTQEIDAIRHNAGLPPRTETNQ